MHICLQALEPNNAAAVAAAAAAAYDGSLEGGSRGGGGRDGRDGQQKLTMAELFPGLEPYQQDAKLQEVRLFCVVLCCVLLSALAGVGLVGD
jgi:hypothetical protein